MSEPIKARKVRKKEVLPRPPRKPKPIPESILKGKSVYIDAFKHFGEQLKQLRLKCGYRPFVLLQIDPTIAYSSSHLVQLEKGFKNQEFSIDRAVKYCKALGIKEVIFKTDSE